ncbi:MAG: hypothetical protein WEB90_02305 [Gemmatimonadota bacterium]
MVVRIHPGQWCPSVLVGALALLASPAWGAAAQVSVTGADTTAVAADASDALGQARAAQARYERARERTFPFTFASGGGPCDEVVGRLCTWFGEGEWIPEPEPAEARRLREGLLAELDSLQTLVPGDAWILGQRVWHRAEGGAWEDALATARVCGAAAPWWCSALEGLALHGLGRSAASERAFEHAVRALDGVAPERARDWRVPERAVDDEAGAWLRALEREGPDALALGLERLWALADPLYLVDGNDRLSEHYARWTVATLKDGARNPFRLRWGRDLEELTVRHGWEIGWERTASTQLGGSFGVIGHRHAEGREYMPSGETLVEPAAARVESFLADRRSPRSLHTPRYAPILLPMESQFAVFPRADRMVLVATAALPEDTSFHALHEHARPWMEPGEQATQPDVRGLFALDVESGRRFERRAEGSTEGALMLEIPVGPYWISVESWSPAQMRAGRARLGLERVPAPPDVAVLSDPLLLQGGQGVPQSLAEALPSVLPTVEVEPRQRVAIAWEVSGLGFRPETFRFTLSVERTDRGLFRRLGEWVGVARRPPSLGLSWEEPGPDRPTHQFHALELDLPDLDPGRYEITLVLATPGRSDVSTRRTFTVVPPRLVRPIAVPDHRIRRGRRA